MIKKIGFSVVAAAFVFSSGFMKKGEDGSFSLDTAAVEKKATEVSAQASAEADKLAGQAADAAASAMEQIKAAAAKYSVSEEEIMADLSKSTDAIKAKVSAMDPAKLVAYLDTYQAVFAGTQDKVAEYTAQVKDLKWSEKFSAKGKELKSQLTQYNAQFSGLKEQCGVYMEKLKSYGTALEAYGIDLSAYGL